MHALRNLFVLGFPSFRCIWSKSCSKISFWFSSLAVNLIHKSNKSAPESSSNHWVTFVICSLNGNFWISCIWLTNLATLASYIRVFSIDIPVAFFHNHNNCLYQGLSCKCVAIMVWMLIIVVFFRNLRKIHFYIFSNCCFVYFCNIFYGFYIIY